MCASSRAARCSCATGVTSQGQGHYTSFAQIVAAELGCDPADVTVVTGDTSRFNWGAGTYASRALVTAGNALALAAHAGPREGAGVAAPSCSRSASDDLELEDGRVRVRGAPGRELTLGALATAANPIRYAYGKEASRGRAATGQATRGRGARGWRGAGLEAVGYFAPPQRDVGQRQHAAIVEVDPATGNVTFVRYVVVHDCGVVINPTIVEGQIHGGVAQGIGGAFYERSSTTTAASCQRQLHGLPDADGDGDPGDRDRAHRDAVPLNPLGVKGVGEAGTIPSRPCWPKRSRTRSRRSACASARCRCRRGGFAS